MGKKQFNRVYTFSAGGAGASGFAVSELHIKFSVQKADIETPNTAKITLWNLAPWQLAILNEKDCIVTLSAGYKDTWQPLIFIGYVTYITTQLDGSDRATDIEAEDGRIELRDTYVSLSYTGKINTKVIVNDIASQMRLPIVIAPDVEFIDIYNGYFFVGSAKDSMHDICLQNELNWGIFDGIIQITKKYGLIRKEVFLISPETGLINVPKKINYGAESNFPEGQEGYEVECFLNGAIAVNNYVRLESIVVSGFFRVYSIEFDGDNVDGDWLNIMKLIKV